MEKQEMIRNMRRHVGGASFITVTQFMRYIGVKTTDTAKKRLKDLERVDNKYYFIPDVAEEMIKRGY